MAYNHLDVIIEQSPMKPGAPCGDVARWERAASGTLLAFADGLGKGIKANVTAEMFLARLMELCRRGSSIRESFSRVATTIDANRLNDGPYAAFCIGWVRSDGEATLLSYDMPPPILMGGHSAIILKGRSLRLEDTIATETVCYLEPGESLLLVTDGVTQAGMGWSHPNGWTIERLERSVEASLLKGVPPSAMARHVHDEARRKWGPVGGDDCTALSATMRSGNVVHLLTGPPLNRNHDVEVVQRFLGTEGVHVVCGGSTTKMVARVLGTRARPITNEDSWNAPPQFRLEGVDLASEGVVTLTQVCRILDKNPSMYEPSGPVSKLARLLRAADKIEITVGSAHNPVNADISYTQQGIMPRTTLVQMLKDILEKQGKLVVMRWC